MSTARSRRSHRWTASCGVITGTLSLLIAVPGTSHAADSATCVTNGRTFVTNSSGDLLQYTMATPLTGSTFSPYTKVASGWGAYGKVLAGPAGEFYAFKSDGTYYAHRTTSGTWDVAPKRISTALGWLANAADREQATVDRDGWLWVADNTGQLYAYRYDATIGSTGGLRSLKILDKGWNRYNLITAGDAGVLYGRATDGRLYRSRYDITSQRWLERHVLVGSAAWGSFKTLTAGGGDTIVAVKTTGEALYYRYDENTRSWPVVAKEVAAGGWQNFPNVSSQPDNCRLTTSHAPVAPAIPLEAYSRTSVMQASGQLELAFTDQNGSLKHGRTDVANLNGAQWTTISSGEAFSGQPSLIEQPDGRVVVTAHSATGSVWQRVQTAKGSPDWNAWEDMAGAMAQHAVTAKTPGGALAQFAVDAGGNPWYRIQATLNGNYMGWMPLTGSGLAAPLTAVTVRDGIQLFGRNTEGILTTAQFKDDGTLSAWTPLGTQATVGVPSVVVFPGYRLRVFSTDPNGRVVTAGQSAEGGAFEGWTGVDGVTAAGAPSAVINPLTGFIEIVVRGTDGYLHNTGESAPGATTWRAWNQAAFEVSATDPTAFVYSVAGADNWAFAFRTANNTTWVYKLDSSAMSATRAGSGAPAFKAQALPAPK
ncbi:tachylectin-related carbohydrate-binding protein [Streptomyces sp. NPDC002659]|uniref:tachylectin-related carbohydrate-binding protein n=1 Tax=Streptomyces sp. NPDC002659 TaxID=3364656 RepID=UPI003682D7D7